MPAYDVPGEADTLRPWAVPPISLHFDDFSQQADLVKKICDNLAYKPLEDTALVCHRFGVF